jgi:hypothetical protein
MLHPELTVTAEERQEKRSRQRYQYHNLKFSAFQPKEWQSESCRHLISTIEHKFKIPPIETRLALMPRTPFEYALADWPANLSDLQNYLNRTQKIRTPFEVAWSFHHNMAGLTINQISADLEVDYFVTSHGIVIIYLRYPHFWPFLLARYPEILSHYRRPDNWMISVLVSAASPGIYRIDGRRRHHRHVYPGAIYQNVHSPESVQAMYQAIKRTGFRNFQLPVLPEDVTASASSSEPASASAPASSSGPAPAPAEPSSQTPLADDFCEQARQRFAARQVAKANRQRERKTQQRHRQIARRQARQAAGSTGSYSD